ncbi:MAG TPA: DUF1501 domain-containing protein [Gemmataceae bacterium]|nr:DUF1501 domain-containing protein [Gemmataceae bacterium]
MLRLLGSPTTLCDGLTRRELLHVGGLAALGLGLSDLFALRAAQAAPARPASRFGKAKACILLFPYGSPPQHETFDPKPDAPAEVQGELKAIPTAVPGLRVCERLPRVARVMDRVTVVRSMTHPYPEHGVAYAVSGIPTYTPALETRPRDPRHWPFIGSVVDYLGERRDGKAPPVPRNVGLPWLLNSRTDLNVSAGPYAAFLGQGYDPVWAEFDGAGTKVAPKYTEGQRRKFHDPFAGVAPAGTFRLPSEGRLPGDVSVERLGLRRSLLEQFDRARAAADRRADAPGFDRHREMAFSLVTSGKMRAALDVRREPLAVRESYGWTLFGQACLAARRLVEAGSQFVTVFWDGFGQFSSCAWDTHANHYPRLKEYLLPGLDLALPALLLDLEARGLLDETLVIWMSEHGRTPRIDPKPKGAGRHHWSRAYSALLAGGGVGRGQVVGASDRLGGDVKDTPVSPKDILATAFHLLGIDPDTTLTDPQGRPLSVAGDGKLRPELLG